MTLSLPARLLVLVCLGCLLFAACAPLRALSGPRYAATVQALQVDIAVLKTRAAALPSAAPAPTPLPSLTPDPLAGEVVSPRGLQLYYSFDDSTAPTRDLSRRGYHARIEGGEWLSTGASGAALAFDGRDDHLVVPAAPGMNLNLGLTLAVCAWVDDFAAPRPLLAWHNRLQSGVALWAFRPGYPWDPNPFGVDLVAAIGDENHHILAAPTFAPMRWRHIAAVYDAAAGSASLYLDGALLLTQNVGSFEPQTSYDLWVAASPDPTPVYFKGRLDELRIYDRPLLPHEILNLAVCASAS